jgi:hypothetical protein
LDTIELRPMSLSRIGMVSLWVLEVAAVAGVALLRRRRVALVPLLSVPVALSAATVMVYGTTRFRAAAEPSLVVLASVAIAAAGVAAYGRLRRGAAPAAVPPDGPSVPAITPAITPANTSANTVAPDAGPAAEGRAAVGDVGASATSGTLAGS